MDDIALRPVSLAIGLPLRSREASVHRRAAGIAPPMVYAQRESSLAPSSSTVAKKVSPSAWLRGASPVRARAARVTPAVFKRCFPSGKALQARVIERLFAARWKPEWDALLVNRAIPYEKRLSRFFVEYRGNIDRDNARLWTRAGLLGKHASGNFSATLATRILGPMVRELRHEAGLADKPGRKVTQAELELAMVLHAAIAFPHTRSNIFGMDVYGTLEKLVPMMVRVWLPGALAEIRRA